MAKEIVETPLMKQYIEMKAKHPDAILLFRVGDFYETFSDDALVASEILGITLTRRANGAAQYVELAGFPHHALDTYLPKLVRAGKRVAICEQLEDPKLTKKLVKRGITELVTPGVSINDNILDHRENNFLAGVHFGKGNKVGVAFLDISTGEFLTAEGDFDYVDKLLGNFSPKEVLFERTKRKLFEEHFGSRFLLSSWTIGFIPRMPLRIAYCVTSRRKTSKVSEFTICPTPLSPRGLCSIIWILHSIRRFRTLHRYLVSRRSDMCDWINSRCGVSNCFLR